VTATMQMPLVQECTVVSCSYNQNGCHAFAITVGGSDGRANCTTFVEMPTRGGIESMIAQVGACKRSDCRHNAELECRAPAITVNADLDMADCVTYETR
jgi:hypothetical protein